MAIQDETLLVIDDVEENCEILKRRLGKVGYKIETANNGREGLVQLTRKSIDLVLLDLNMPVMNGFTFLEKVKSNDKYSNIPIVITTSIDDEDTATDCLMFGANNYIYKPYNMTEVLSAIRYILDDD